MEANLQRLNDSVNQVFELSSRIDERLKSLVESNQESKERIEKLVVNQTNILTRIIVLENESKTIEDVKKDIKILEQQVDLLSERVIHVEKEVGAHSNKWTNLIDFGFKVGHIVIGAIILYKLGFK